MSLLTEEEIQQLTINKMIFHVVGKGLTAPITLKEITPLIYNEFFLARIKSSLKGNLFKFKANSNVERILRIMSEINKHPKTNFTEESKQLAVDFHTKHKGNASKGAFFVFELNSGVKRFYALLKYENDEVVRYYLDANKKNYKPKLEFFTESFTRKADSIQKVALVKLDPVQGGDITVLDRSNRSHISEYFEGFLEVKRSNSIVDLNVKLLDALKDVFKENRSFLPEHVATDGVKRIYKHLGTKEFSFDTVDPDTTLTAIFGPLDDIPKIKEAFNKKVKESGFLGESFQVKPEYIEKPATYKWVTKEGVTIIFDDNSKVQRKPLPNGKYEIKIITTGLKQDDFNS